MNKKIIILGVIFLLSLILVISGCTTYGAKGGIKGKPQCNDGIDNDGDTKIDYPSDPGCTSRGDNNERSSIQCDDGIDNDGDTKIDYPSDLGCTSPSDSSEFGSAQCDDGIDNTDADTLKDYPSDLGCISLTDPSEVDGDCDDGTDNDGDGAIDYLVDVECTSFASREGNCVDSDGGFVTGTQGTVSGSRGGFPYSNTDFCLESNLTTSNLKEYSCDSVGEVASSTYNCAGNLTTSCVNGACV